MLKNGNYDAYKKAARHLGVKMRLFKLRNRHRAGLLTYQDRSFIISGDEPGFYPEAKRWTACAATDKSLAQDLLKKANFKTITSKKFAITDYPSQAALLKDFYRKNKSYPVLLKPNGGLRGRGISIANSNAEANLQIAHLYKKQKDFLVQPLLDHDEYRVLIINDRVELFYEKKYPHVTGDGKQSLKKLLTTVPETEQSPYWIKNQCKIKQLTLSDILKKGDQFTYHTTKRITPDCFYTTKPSNKVKNWGRGVARAFGASVIGIDLFVPNDIDDPDSFIIIEVNSNPGLQSLHFLTGNSKLAEDIFTRVMKDYFKI